jgi:hypothetical protein
MNLVAPCPVEQACIRIASSRKELSHALQLVYESYLDSGLIEPNPYHVRVLPQHKLPTTEVVIAGIAERVVGTATLVRDSLLGLPVESLYARDVEVRRQENLYLAEISCLADGRGGLSRHALIDLMAFTVQCAKARGVDQILIAVHPRHVKFYLNCLGFYVFGGLRSYDAVCGNPAIGLCLDLETLQARSPAAYRRLFGRPHPAEHLAYRALPNDAQRYTKQLAAAVRSYEAANSRSPAMAS